MRGVVPFQHSTEAGQSSSNRGDSSAAYGVKFLAHADDVSCLDLVGAVRVPAFGPNSLAVVNGPSARDRIYLTDPVKLHTTTRGPQRVHCGPHRLVLGLYPLVQRKGEEKGRRHGTTASVSTNHLL
ncbi:uncharacterized protein SETTUDRAFT_157600 [Exserohilum turcica Et28A]|uniref:Uncharacterized protein n=1 Tax=Exserohilum turcicum (strain 28A) TaxID=671987 RepID=R0JZT8_EXST2|nr:uncharacterized protein SETTUDRAFT_157600 [Exserohilum turcica Et28A]EOA81697.1 hypothetical protein SETTUDRAFT_157600 [Exserohilum turcica Et28A]